MTPSPLPSNASADTPVDTPASDRTGITSRLARQDWHGIEAQLDAFGCARIPALLEARECDDLKALYPRDERFRSRVVMARHGFGLGEYKYLCYPLPPLVSELRQAAYRRLVPMANRWQEALHVPVRYPAEHAQFLRQCHEAGQRRPTPLVLRYTAGDYNCLHQDLYGEHAFPLQMAILPDRPGLDFTGGEFVMTEQRPRRQSRPEVVPLDKGDAVVFAVHTRPVAGSRGIYRVNHRHGVSRLRSVAATPSA